MFGVSPNHVAGREPETVDFSSSSLTAKPIPLYINNLLKLGDVVLNGYEVGQNSTTKCSCIGE